MTPAQADQTNSPGDSAPDSGAPRTTDAAEPPAQNAAVRTAVGDTSPRSYRVGILWFLAIFLVALGLRGIYLYQVRACPFYGHEIMDSGFYREWGEALAAGERYWEGPYFRGPLYPYFLAGIYAVCGKSDLAPRIAQIILGAASCGLVYLIGTLAFRRRVGVLAGFMAATYGLFLYFEAELLIVTLAVFLDLLLIWLLLVTGDRRKPWLWLVCGGVLGLSAIARPNILLLSPAVLIWLAILHRPNLRRMLGYAACLVVGAALFIAPVTIRNYVAGEDRVLISSSAGVNFYIGNNPGSDGMSAIVPGTPAELWPGYYAQIERAEQAAGRSLKPSEVSRYYWGEGFDFIRDNPSEAALLLLKKFGYFWSRWEVSNNQDIRFVTDNFAPVVRYLPLTFLVVGPLGLLGLVLSLRRPRRLFPLWGFVLIYMVGVVAFFVTARYRAPVVPVLMVLGSHAVFWCLEQLRARRWLAAGYAVGVLAVAGIAAWQIPEGVEVGIGQSCGEAGIVLASQDRLDEAEDYLRQSLERYPDHPGMAKYWLSLGIIEMRQNSLFEAERCFTQAAALSPDDAETRKYLALMLAQQNKTDRAIGEFRRALVLAPDDAFVHANLGAALIRKGQVAEGIQKLRRAVEIDASNASYFEIIAVNLRAEQRLADAVRVVEAGLDVVGEDAGLLTAMARLLAAGPNVSILDPQRARRCAERACVLTNWGNPEAMDALAVAHVATGDIEQAISVAQRARQLAIQLGEQRLANAIGRRLQFYRSLRPRATSQPTAMPDKP